NNCTQVLPKCSSSWRPSRQPRRITLKLNHCSTACCGNSQTTSKHISSFPMYIGGRAGRNQQKKNGKHLNDCVRRNKSGSRRRTPANRPRMGLLFRRPTRLRNNDSPSQFSSTDVAPKRGRKLVASVCHRPYMRWLGFVASSLGDGSDIHTEEYFCLPRCCTTSRLSTRSRRHTNCRQTL